MTLSKHDQISLELHHLVKIKLMESPGAVIAHAQNNLKRWRKQNGEGFYWMSEWDNILAQGAEAVGSILTGLDQRSILLRSSSPFPGIITQGERMAILDKFKENE